MAELIPIVFYYDIIKPVYFQCVSNCCGYHFNRVAANIPFSAVSYIQYTEGSHRAVEVALGGLFAARKRKGGICYGTQNHTEAAGKNQRPCTQDLL